MTKSKDWEERFIHQFCNDHNGEVRFLRGVFYDEKDGAEEIMQFIEKEISLAVKEAKKEVRKNMLHHTSIRKVANPLSPCCHSTLTRSGDKVYCGSCYEEIN